MGGSVRLRALLFAALVLAAVVFVLPTLANPVPTWWPWQQPVRLGLDLQGGTHLLYQVQIDAGIDNRVEQIGRDVESALRDAQVGAFTVERQGRTLQVRLATPDKRADVKKVLQDKFPSLVLNESAGGESADFSLSLSTREEQQLRDRFVDQALQILRNRIDQFGVSEPTILAQGTDEIVVQLPGIQDPQRAKDLIGRTALLEFRLVAEGPQAGTPQNPGAGMQAVAGRPGDRNQYVTEKRPIVTGDMLTDAQVRPGGVTEGYAVDFAFDARGASLFGDATTRNVHRRLAIVLDGVVQSAPEIREPITGGHGQITGRFDFKEAQDLANVLRNGALPAPLKLLEERTVGPSLGRDSIRQGTISFAVGSALVVLFMMAYYRGGGVIADVALMINLLLILGAFAAFGFTLTLPGIAGIVLTVGMAVDANILILERMREELRTGKSVRAAVDTGYEKAWNAIFDSNITTFLSGLILFQFGTGPVRGFAVTLCLGILTTMTTAVFLTRVVYDWLVIDRRMTAVSI
jgi:preprotein translocase subunit SecD